MNGIESMQYLLRLRVSGTILTTGPAIAMLWHRTILREHVSGFGTWQLEIAPQNLHLVTAFATAQPYRDNARHSVIAPRQFTGSSIVSDEVQTIGDL